MSDCIVALQLRVKALILLFFIHVFFISLYCMLKVKIVSGFSQEALKLES